MANITPRQKAYDIEEEVFINGEDMLITGNMSFHPTASTPNGSFTLKVKSSLLTDNAKDRKRLEAAFLTAFRDAAFGDDGLFAKIDGANDVKKSGNPNQLSMKGSFDTIKKAAAGSDGPEDAIVVDDKPVKKKAPAKKAAAKSDTAAPEKKATAAAAKPPKKTNAKLQAVAARGRANQAGTEIAEA